MANKGAQRHNNLVSRKDMISCVRVGRNAYTIGCELEWTGSPEFDPTALFHLSTIPVHTMVFHRIFQSCMLAVRAVSVVPLHCTDGVECKQISRQCQTGNRQNESTSHDTLHRTGVWERLPKRSTYTELCNLPLVSSARQDTRFGTGLGAIRNIIPPGVLTLCFHHRTFSTCTNKPLSCELTQSQ